MMFPGDTLLMSNYLTVVKMNLLDNYLGMCITSFVGATQTFMLRQKFLSIPRDLQSAAEIDGWGDIRFILRVLLPVAKPVVVTLVG
jgi:ABC-type glycerol-3-phosphate transport system permease component